MSGVGDGDLLNATLGPNGSDGALQNCTYPEDCISIEAYWQELWDYIFPTRIEWVLIAFHCLAFLVGLIGNALVCVAVYRNHTMRTVTNYFIVNLALADFLVILFCLPPTVLWDVTETWFFGTAMCKIVLYLQTVSVAVSVLTLTFISVDRWYAICFPLKFKSTTNRAKTAIIVIWLLALSFDIPDLIVLRTQPKELRVETILLTQCEPSWSHQSDITFTAVKVVLLYTCPLLFMSVAYCQIVRVLWRSANIPGHAESNKYKPYHNNGVTGGRRNTLNSAANATTECQLRSRRKAAKMLVAVVVMFAVCYFPVHLLQILSNVMELPQNQPMTIFSMLSHWLCYANSAVNPVIYNFMSAKYRREFRRTFGIGCCVGELEGGGDPRGRDRAMSVGNACRYTTTTSALHGGAGGGGGGGSAYYSRSTRVDFLPLSRTTVLPNSSTDMDVDEL